MNPKVPIRRATTALAVFLLLAALWLTPALAPRACAATHAIATHRRHLNFVQRHPTLTAIGAGVVTHHALKVMAARDKARGKKLNFAERHPTLSAIGVGVVTHHEIKKHTPK